MIVGDPRNFAIESEITLAYDQLNQLALGFFVVHLKCQCYGVRERDATMLADPFTEVGRIISRRGSHNPPFPMTANAVDIANSFRRAFYDKAEEGELFFKLSLDQFKKAVTSKCIDWTANFDEAFDDSSYILQLEDEDRVRLIAFQGTQDFRYEPITLSDVHLSPEAFYGILQEWRDRFSEEWRSSTKVTVNLQP